LTTFAEPAGGIDISIVSALARFARRPAVTPMGSMSASIAVRLFMNFLLFLRLPVAG
jgi:hypothetical protein